MKNQSLNPQLPESLASTSIDSAQWDPLEDVRPASWDTDNPKTGMGAMLRNF